MPEPIHYVVTGDGLSLYAGSELVMTAHKDYQLVQVAKDALTGKLTIPASPDPIVITDHPWLLRLVSGVTLSAARLMEGNT